MQVTVPNLIRMREQNKKIVMLTAYDFTFARLVDRAGVDIILVGDSLGTVIQGNETTLPVTLDEILYHSRLVARATERAMVVGDMPFMSYQLGPKEALAAAGRLVKEAGVGAVKLEGGISVCETIRTIDDAGIPVMGHVGLTPQSYHKMGGHRIQGKTQKDADRIIEEAKMVEEAGAFSIVLEGIPEDVAREITNSVCIPTIGIGAGIHCSGQVLVLHDLLGITPLEEGESPPKFVKAYANLRETTLEAVRQFVAEVEGQEFPGPDHSYYVKRDNVREFKKLRKTI